MSGRCNISLSATLSHAQPTSQKTPVNDLNNPILLLFRHLVIAGKAKPSTENIGSYVDSRALYVSICAASAITFYRDKRIRPVYRLHMHGLPDWPTLYVLFFQGFPDLSWSD